MTHTLEARNKLIIELHQLGLGHAEIAADFGITRERVRQIIKRELGVSTPRRYNLKSKRQTIFAALAALETGISPDQTAFDASISKRSLSSLFLSSVGKNPREIAFQVWSANQIGQTYNAWQVLSVSPASPASVSISCASVKARCLMCGTVHRVSFRNIASGASRMCHSCGVKHRRNGVPAVDTATATLFPSLKAASAASGISYYKVRKESKSTNVPIRFCRANTSIIPGRQGKVHKSVAQ